MLFFSNIAFKFSFSYSIQYSILSAKKKNNYNLSTWRQYSSQVIMCLLCTTISLRLYAAIHSFIWHISWIPHGPNVMPSTKCIHWKRKQIPALSKLTVSYILLISSEYFSINLSLLLQTKLVENVIVTPLRGYGRDLVVNHSFWETNDKCYIFLSRCRVLNMNKNHLTSFKQLPKIPQIQHLSLAENHIESLTGLSSLQRTPLESLMLKRNPCEFHQNYRKR